MPLMCTQYSNRCRRMLAGVVTGLILVLLAVDVQSLEAAGATTGPATQTVDEAEAFFAGGGIPRLRIEIGPQEMESLRRDARAYVRASVRELEPGQPDRVYPSVAVHLKGKWGSFRGLDDRPGLTLNFERYPGGRRFHGLGKLHLNNSVQDPTYLSEIMGRSLFRAAGVPTPRASHARVWLNEKDLGIYVLLEGMDRSFLQRSFGRRTGNVLEGALQEIDQPLSVIVMDRALAAIQAPKESPEGKKLLANAEEKARGVLKDLMAAVRERDPSLRRQKLEQVLDADRFRTFMAMEALTAHWDGYCANRNNYRIYHDPGADRCVFLAHGMDQLFRQANYPLLVNNATLARVMLETPEDRWRYMERVAELRQTLFTPEALAARLDAIAARTIPAFAQISPDAARHHQEQVASLKRQMMERVRGIDRQLAAFPRPLKFDAAGVASLKGWQLQQQSGQASLDRVTENGKAALRIRSGKGGCTASLRTTVLLPKGKYVFEGQCRAAQLAADGESGGVGLRISGATGGKWLQGNADWQKCEYPIEVAEASREVVLVCEVKAKSGEAAFDEQSLVLRKR